MRPVAAGLVTFLQSRTPCYKADLYDVTLNDGVTVYYWTDFDQPIKFGNLYSSLGPALQRSRIGVKHTVEVPELEIRVLTNPSILVGGLPFTQQLHNGYLDGATIQIQRLYMPTPGDTSLGSVLLFAGRMSEAKIDALGAVLTVKGANVLMNQQVPRNTYQTPCLHTFCDPGCTLVAATFTTSFTVAGGTTNSLIVWSAPPGTPSNYNLGKIKMTSGVAIGQIRTIKVATAGGVQLAYPLYNTPAPGDTFTAMKGCDRTYSSGSGQDCTAYSNTQHFRGFPFVPPAETAF